MNKWNAIEQSIRESSKKIGIIEVDNSAILSASKRFMLPPESTLGIVINNCGGIVIDNWIRIYGSGEIDICSKNDLYGIDCVIVAEDILGGLFLLLEKGEIGYFAPDTLEVENMKFSYSQFLYWCIQGDTNSYYHGLRWQCWDTEVDCLTYDKAVFFYPFLWTQAESIDKRTRKIISMAELVRLELEMHEKIMHGQ